MNAIKGLHHVTAISGNPHENFQFYTKVLGLKLVKKTVNFDDPSTYHLYYGDATGSPGTLMTFFPYPGRQGKKGKGQVTSTSYSVPPGELDSWRERLEAAGWPFQTEDRFGSPVLTFEDPHGLGLEIVETPTHEDLALTKFAGVTLTLQKADPTVKLLEMLGFQFEAQEGPRRRMRLPEGHDVIDILESPEAPQNTGGPGTVHHIALRVENRDDQLAWRKKLVDAGYHVSPVTDRNYFFSIYFRGPGGILCEIATDEPGMMIDETVEELGTHLKFPPQYEPYRQQIERQLAPIEEPYHALEKEGKGATVVALHGTGGDEYDLLTLVGELAPGHPVLSLRGNVSEGGMNRFFRRLRDGVFDQDDLARRRVELSEFLKARVGPRIGIGYSNGANMIAATLMSDAESFDKVVLLRPMLGWEVSTQTDLRGKDVLLLIGVSDTVVSPQSGRELAEALRSLGANVTIQETPGGHGLTAEDIELAKNWLELQKPVTV